MAGEEIKHRWVPKSCPNCTRTFHAQIGLISHLRTHMLFGSMNRWSSSTRQMNNRQFALWKFHCFEHFLQLFVIGRHIDAYRAEDDFFCKLQSQTQTIFQSICFNKNSKAWWNCNLFGIVTVPHMGNRHFILDQLVVPTDVSNCPLCTVILPVREPTCTKEHLSTSFAVNSSAFIYRTGS